MKIKGRVAEIISIIRSKSIRLILNNISERIVFDRINGIDTITQIPIDQFDIDNKNVKHALHYSSSWTSEIRFGFFAARELLGERFSEFSFIDIGCGRGKVVVKWTQLTMKASINQAIFGVDYYLPLVEAAEENHRIVFGRDGVFICADVTECNFSDFGDKLILYLFNPFNNIILSKMIDRIGKLPVVMIYNNPVHEQLLLENDFQVIAEKRGFHPQAQTIVLSRNI